LGVMVVMVMVVAKRTEWKTMRTMKRSSLGSSSSVRRIVVYATSRWWNQSLGGEPRLVRWAARRDGASAALTTGATAEGGVGWTVVRSSLTDSE
jgi:hypothetical protein